MASFDIYELKQQVRATLPAGRLVICRDSQAWKQGLSWDCHAAAGAPIVIKLGWRGKNPDGTPLQDDAGKDGPAVALTLTGALQ
ncbi:MAG TPA: hypothetical protein VGP06_00940 [Janthinobacterium sp.]|nr:hypothetical protein [Janthinobacterium sp.]